MGGPRSDEPGWTNPSVRAFAGDDDPLDKVVDVAHRVMIDAADAGLGGPPFDPFRLAEMLGLSLRARADVADAQISVDVIGVRTTPTAPLREFVPTVEPLSIEYNPTRPRGRLRYSVAHEVAHALFPDVTEAIRHRTVTGATPVYGSGDAWQLELLCNVAAAELLMPVDAVEGILNLDPDIDFLMAQRRRFDVSTEAFLRRLTTATTRPFAMLATSRTTDMASAPLRVEYVVGSHAWRPELRRGAVARPAGPLGTCTAVGQTARGEEQLSGERLHVQAVGTPGYPGLIYPRVLALAQPLQQANIRTAGIRFVTGDVTTPDAYGPVIIAHVVTDAARSWSRRGVARALANRFPQAAKAYHYWTVADPDNLRLGNVHLIEAASDSRLRIASMVAQRGYGAGSPPRLVYNALAEALGILAEVAARDGTSVHLPRLGTGQAGGRWDLIEAEIDAALVRRGIPVTVYTLPAHLQRGSS